MCQRVPPQVAWGARRLLNSLPRPIMQSDQHTADIMLRSSDGKLFRSWETFLSMSSPVFSDMAALSQPDTSQNIDGSGRPVIDLAEDSRTLEHILFLCHPASCTGRQFKIEDVRELGAVLDATVKYDMENVRSVVLGELTRPSFLRQDPLRVYALACQHKCREAAQLAAEHTLTLPAWVHGYVPELEKIHAGNLLRLFLYREARITAARTLADEHDWIVYTGPSPLFNWHDDEDEGVGWITARHPPSRKHRQGRAEKVSVHNWWLDYMRKSGCALQKSPQGDTVKDDRLVRGALSATSSSRYAQYEVSEVREAFRSFVDSFAEKIDRSVAEVDSDLELEF